MHNKLNLIPRTLWATWESGIQKALTKRAFQQAWVIVRETSDYGQEFEKLINDWAGTALTNRRNGHGGMTSDPELGTIGP